ncbi:MAG: hypothetical protein ACOX4Q_15450 [Syntrophomonadales bacterium]
MQQHIFEIRPQELVTIACARSALNIPLEISRLPILTARLCGNFYRENKGKLL